MTRAAQGELLRWLKDRTNHQSDECLVWPYWTFSNGYAGITVGARQTTASRIMCELVHGDAPEAGMQCAHSCGNRLCVNPRHLRWSTIVDNHADKIGHGTTNRGERQGQSRLTERQVIWARKAVELRLLSQSAIARMFGVHVATIHAAVRGRNWKFIETARVPEPTQEAMNV